VSMKYKALDGFLRNQFNIGQTISRVQENAALSVENSLKKKEGGTSDSGVPLPPSRPLVITFHSILHQYSSMQEQDKYQAPKGLKVSKKLKTLSSIYKERSDDTGTLFMFGFNTNPYRNWIQHHFLSNAGNFIH
jgi:hypothetical protein